MARRGSVSPVTAAEVGAGDLQCDVLVVGFGCAGGSAAYEAATAGADVLIIERASGPGGASALSGGEVYLGGGTALQEACGFTDTPEQMKAFLLAALGPDCDEDKVTAYCNGSVEHYDWLVARGIPFTPSVWDAPTWVPPTEDGLMWLGEAAYPFPEHAVPVPRGHRPTVKDFGGWLLMDKLKEAATAAGARTQTDTVAERLVVEDGRVVGVVARQFGEQVTIRAKRGVVLTTGGFVDDDEMLRQHAPQLVGHEKVSCGGEDGSGIRMAQAVGAAVRHMSAGQVAITLIPGMAARGMVVNGRGQRFINEDCYPGRIGQAALFRQGLDCWVVLDEKGYEEVPEKERWGVRPHFVAATVAELEAEIGIPTGGLQKTVELYNAHAAIGEDPLFHKRPQFVRPLEPPYAAIDPKRCFRGPTDPPGSGAAVFTLGGLVTTVDGHVLDLDGNPIAGLYAAGRSTSGLASWGYVSGTSLGDGTYFGRRAGRAAAGSPIEWDPAPTSAASGA
ncbi:MAG: 3-oxo-5alpha-steroid 4-dehydrogenase [Actinomycetota bacterium]|nr:3-oxo-5alpha-steroid 4-dehydrogenase [Actinomycetota bacterium]